ncbi:hypothetical protein [Pararhizobium sp. PWRC1-1]|uniref:hypothetical protein n=1 Tax=Pararhizobium sp. PWRC1-1 TaxID=2804566 RepID=UPI003CF13E29
MTVNSIGLFLAAAHTRVMTEPLAIYRAALIWDQHLAGGNALSDRGGTRGQPGGRRGPGDDRHGMEYHHFRRRCRRRGSKATQQIKQWND